MTSIEDVARRWRDDDPDPDTRAQTDRLLSTGDRDELERCFGDRLRFGTAGLRGALGPGPNRMNRATVRRATAGLIDHLDRTGQTGPVVVGGDARHGTAEFVEEVVAVVGGAGRTTVVLPTPCPTPLCAFTVLEVGAAAGVQVTASHNPPGDNGYKVFLADGAQVVSPVDRAIADRIDAIETLAGIPLDAAGAEPVPDRLVDAYLEAVVGARVAPGAAGVPIAYTAMHGVGGALTLEAFERAGFPVPHVVADQHEPDPDFPTVEFPNPEEPGAMDQLLAVADAAGVDLALAHDPDADRLGAAVRVDGGWRALRGDEIGILLADHLLTHTDRPDPVVATTVVSSRQLFTLAAARGARAVETLTGFKWVARAADDLLFGYEEALGYAVSGRVRDKDGISAAIVLTEAAGVLASRGRSLIDRLDELAVECGVHETGQVVVRAADDDLDRLAARLDVLRREPPIDLDGQIVLGMVDLAEPGGPLPPTNAVVLQLDGARVVLRPSGTEPKLKCYLEVVTAPEPDVAAARARARDRLGTLAAAVEALVS